MSVVVGATTHRAKLNSLFTRLAPGTPLTSEDLAVVGISADLSVHCCFVPRPFETDADALKVPFFHSNDDYDEVIFDHRGAFFSRDAIGPGMLTLHPCGVPHGPHPKALARAMAPRQAMSDEVAVMIDARDPLDVAPLPGGIERPGYAMS